MLARFECPRCQTVFTREKGDDDAFVECPSCGALAMSAGDATGVDSDALARALSSSHDAPTQLQPEGGLSTQPPSQEAPSDPPEPSDPSAPRPGDPFSSSGAGIFSALLDRPDEAAAPPPPEASKPVPKAVAAKDGIDLGLDDDFKDFALPSTSPGSPALSPQKKTPPKKAPPTKTAEKASSSPSPAPPPRKPQPEDDFSGEGAPALTEEAFGALEAAFDVMAAKPTGNKLRGKDGLSEEDRAFLRGEKEQDSSSSSSAKPPPKRPPARPGERPPARARPPVPKGGRRPARAARGLALSDEAREAAFLPLRPEASGAVKRKTLPPEMDDGTIEAPVSDHAESTVPQQMAPPREAGRGGPVGKRPEPTELLEKKPATKPAIRQRPSILGGVPAIALSVAVFVGLAGGAAVGALTAPQAVKRNDARARAEVQLAEGNRFYEQGRFDDALGKYKAAISIDRAFALAHRAKGAALAKQQRWDEAAAAYKEYLGLESSAIDAVDVKEALQRRGVEVDKPPEKTGGGG